MIQLSCLLRVAGLKLSISCVCISLAFCSVLSGQSEGAEKANRFISSLSTDQATLALEPFYHLSPHEWTFYPASMMFPSGVAVKDLNESQKGHLYDFIQAYLSEEGLLRTRAIMDLEIILHTINPQNPHRIPENYYMTIYGTPHADSLWGWSFQGHHVVLNFTMVGDQVAFSPLFFGANPAEILSGPSKGTRTITEEEDYAYDLVHSMDLSQLSKAIFQQEPFVEIVTFSSIQAGRLAQVGLPVTDMTSSQRLLLDKLLEAYLSALPSFIREERMKRIRKEEAGALWFGWAGSTERGKPHYYRVQGHTFLIEFDNTQNNANHIHMVWREFDRDFGRDLLQEHYLQAHSSGHK